MYSQFNLYLLILFFNSINCKNNLYGKQQDFIESIDNGQYNKYLRPNHGGKEDVVNVSLFIKDISVVSEAGMEFTSDIYLRHSWLDGRLAFNQSNSSDKINVGTEFAKKIWLPDTFIINSKQISSQTSANSDINSLLRIYSNGTIFYSVRMSVVALCSMNLKYFPMDTQICRLEFESYGYPMEELDYFWTESPMMINAHSVSLSNFRVKGYRNYRIIQSLDGIGYVQLNFDIVLIRSIVYYINQIYIPAIMIVVMSWIPFWLDRDDNHARIGLGVTTVLTMTTLVTNTNQSMPKISYMKSLDVYLEVCFAMVFASLMQYATVGYLNGKCLNKVSDSRKPELKDNENTSFGGHSPTRIDYNSRWIFPTVFSIFNLIYWSVYWSLSRVTVDGMIAAV